MERANVIAEMELSVARSKCDETIERIVKDRCSRSIPALLHHDVHALVVASCVSIAARKAKVRVRDWVERNLTVCKYEERVARVVY